jgi:RNA polymerase sigma-70 factor (ECF subfamily)
VNHDELQLIDRCLAGDTAAFGELVCKYQDRLFNTMVHVCGSVEEARDVVQDAFVQAFVKLDTFQRASAFYTWLYRIAFNAAVSRRRKKRPTISVEAVREASGLEPPDTGEGPESRLERQERVALVQAGLAELSDEHREVLVLKEIDGYRYEEIAEMLDLPIGTVRSRLFRARMQLRDRLKEVLADEVDLGNQSPPGRVESSPGT